MKLQKESVHIVKTTDGREFLVRRKGDEADHESRAHQAGLNLVKFLSSAILERDAENVLKVILEDPDGFREVIGPLLRRPRSKSEAKRQTGDVESFTTRNEPREFVYEPIEGSAEAPAEQAPKRRGRPKGSKNKPKAVANGEGARAET